MTFTTEILLFLILGFVVLGPRSMQAMFAHVVRAKAEFDKATRTFKAQLAAEPDSSPSAVKHKENETEA